MFIGMNCTNITFLLIPKKHISVTTECNSKHYPCTYTHRPRQAAGYSYRFLFLQACLFWNSVLESTGDDPVCPTSLMLVITYVLHVSIVHLFIVDKYTRIIYPFTYLHMALHSNTQIFPLPFLSFHIYLQVKLADQIVIRHLL